MALVMLVLCVLDKPASHLTAEVLRLQMHAAASDFFLSLWGIQFRSSGLCFTYGQSHLASHNISHLLGSISDSVLFILLTPVLPDTPFSL